jgi:uncharacterized protein
MASVQATIHPGRKRLPWRQCKLPLLFLSAAFAVPVHAQVSLIPEAGGGNYLVPVKTWWDIPFRSIVRQRYDFSCGSAAVATLLTHHYGIPTTEAGPFAAMWKAGDRAQITKAGFSMFDMKLYLQSIGMKAEGYRLPMSALAKGQRPAIVLLDLNGFKHFVVIKGFHSDTVLIGDPIRGLTKYPVAAFAKAWNGIALVIREAPDNRRPGYNLALDWNPWATAPIAANSATASISDLTTHLTAPYQISPQILLDVRVGTVR